MKLIQAAKRSFPICKLSPVRRITICAETTRIREQPSASQYYLTTLIEDEIHEARLEIIDANRQAVITVIEILSPTNKIVGSRGRASYEQKRKGFMTSSTHLVEIELLRDDDDLHCREILPEAD
jgi:hypothetical protein